MTDASPLQQRLRLGRYHKATRACAEVLDGIGIAEGDRRFLDLREVEGLWPRYLSRLRDGGDSREQWPLEQTEHVRLRIDELRDAASGVRMVWFALADTEPVGVEVPAAPILAAGFSYLVSPAGDLMLATQDLADGVCIELNHLATGDEYEVVTWGRFSL